MSNVQLMIVQRIFIQTAIMYTIYRRPRFRWTVNEARCEMGP